MCLALVNRTSLLPEDYFINAALVNGDGMGMLYIENGKLETFKTLNVDDFYEHYTLVRRGMPEFGIPGNTLPILLHWRMATHGEVGTLNCHPFMVNDKVGFIHNGVFSGMPYDAVLSDTQVFNNTFLRKLPYNRKDVTDKNNFLNSEGIRDIIFDYCVKNFSKLAFLEVDGSVSIFNSKAGHNDTDGNWFSNDSYKPRYWNAKSFGTYAGSDQWKRTTPVAAWAEEAYASYKRRDSANSTSSTTTFKTAIESDWDDDGRMLFEEHVSGAEAYDTYQRERSGITPVSSGINLKKLDNDAETEAYLEHFAEISNMAWLYIDDKSAINGLSSIEQREVEQRFIDWHNDWPYADYDAAEEAINIILAEVVYAAKPLDDVAINMNPTEEDRLFAAAISAYNNEQPVYGSD